VPDWLADLFPQGGGGQATVTPAIVQETTALPLQIPQSLVSVLLSNNSAAIKNISAATGANISVRQDCMHLGYSLAFFSGTAQSTAKARDMVQQHVGLTSGSSITKQIGISAEHIDVVMGELRQKSSTLPISVLPPEGSGTQVRIVLGPAQVAHVATAESLIRKKVDEIELELFSKQRRPVPPERKIPVACKFYAEGNCSRISCQYCHGPEELAVASKACLPAGMDIAGAKLARPAPVSSSSALTATPATGTSTSGLL